MVVILPVIIQTGLTFLCLVEEFLRAGVEFDIKGRKLVDVQKIFHQMEQRTLSAAYKFYCNKILECGTQRRSGCFGNT